MIRSLYLGRVNYDEGLRLQAEMAALCAEGRAPNRLLLLEHPPVLTLGRNANRANILASSQLLASRGITVHEIDRGGDVTYHGPGQLVGYPIFNLRALRSRDGGRIGPVDFVRRMEEALIRLCGDYGVEAGRIAGLTGVWCSGPGGILEKNAAENAAKIGAIGIHVSRGITTHGFAFNVTTDLRDFSLIVPCGIRDHAVTSLKEQLRPGAVPPSLEAVAARCAHHFGEVLNEPVEDAGSLAALRAAAETSPAQIGSAQVFPDQIVPDQVFPAQDTPLQVPAEIERLHSAADKPVRS